ncbi:MAG: O-antigen ligase family protein [Verrucomicrobia bacterium]|nr:O-antigen ligase family protein [Verrucomicrobiota bacterium]
MSGSHVKPSETVCIQPAAMARVLLMGYAVALPVRGTAALQAALLLIAFMLLVWERRNALADAWEEARWALGPLLVFSIWMVLICGFWREPPFCLDWFAPARPANLAAMDIQQPWFSLDQWRRDIGQPMIALLCGFWAFRETRWKRWLFAVLIILLAALAVKCLCQFFLGERDDGRGGGSTVAWLRGTLAVRGFSRDNIFLSYVLFLLTPAMLWLALERRTGWRGWARAGFLLGLFGLIFLNKRRGTWTALYAELFLITLWMGRRVWLAYLLGTVLVAMAAYQVRPEWFNREYDTEKKGRLEILRDAIPLLQQHPYVGVGFGKDTVVKNYWHKIYQHAHNTFVNITLETGWAGLALWLSALAVYAKRFWKARAEGWGARIGLAFLIGFCVRNLTDDIWLSSNAELFWFLIGVFLPQRSERRDED